MNKLWNGLASLAKRFMPHAFKNEVKMLGSTPKILITKSAYDTMFYIVEGSAEEVGWLGTVERAGMSFLISEVFLFEQEVHSTQTKLDPEDIGKFFTNLLMQEGGIEKSNEIRFWGHSHVNMGVTPSGSYGPGSYGDLSQMHKFGEAAEYFIMGIANKNGEIRFEIFFYDLGVKIEDVEWSLYEPENESLKDRIKAELTQKVHSAPPVIIPSYDFGFGNNNYHSKKNKKSFGGDDDRF